MKELAQAFGTALDQDDFERCRSLLSNDCTYDIGDDTLVGPKAICCSYENNMIEGRKKLDKLVWGQSTVVEIEPNLFEVHFTDYLTHRGTDHTHRCKQLITVEKGKIVRIVHIHNKTEHEALQSFYKSVGLPYSKS